MTRPPGTAGFTLIELVVTMLVGMIVSFAAFALIDTSLHAQKRTADRADATRRGRIAIEQLVQEMHSACLSPAVGPVLASGSYTDPNTNLTVTVNSDAWNIVFISGLGSGLTPSATEHIVSLSNGTWTDTWLPQNGGGVPNETFSGTPSTQRTLLTNIPSTYSPGGTPIFTYYTYSNPSNPNSNSLVNAVALTTPLSSTASATNYAGNVAKVSIALKAGPTSGSTAADTTLTMNDTAVFRYSPALEGTTAVNTPCA